jgi:hypothetical protein
MHLLAEQVSTKKQKTKLVEAKKVISTLKGALVRSDTKSVTERASALASLGVAGATDPAT